MAIIFALVRSTTSTALGQRWAAKPYARPTTRPNVHAPPIYKRPHSVSTSRGPQSLSSPHPHRPEHYQPVTAPDQPGTKENPVSLVLTGDMIEDKLMASKQEANIHKPLHTGIISTMSGQHSQPETTETMTDNHPEDHHQPLPEITQKPQEATTHQPPHTGGTSMMPGQHSLPDSTETMTDDHPEHRVEDTEVNVFLFNPPSPPPPPPSSITINTSTQKATVIQPPHTGVTPVMPGQPSLPIPTEIITKPGPISKTLKSSAAASEEPPMTPVAIMPSEELTNPIEVMAEVISEHDEMISTLTIHKFKEVLHEIIKDAVDKIVMKKAGIVGKLITAKQNLIGHDGEVTGREFQAMDTCLCDQDLFDRRGRGDCNSRSLDFNGRKWCFLETFSFCHDEVASRQFPGRFWSHDACL